MKAQGISNAKKLFARQSISPFCPLCPDSSFNRKRFGSQLKMNKSKGKKGFRRRERRVKTKLWRKKAAEGTWKKVNPCQILESRKGNINQRRQAPMIYLWLWKASSDSWDPEGLEFPSLIPRRLYVSGISQSPFNLDLRPLQEFFREKKKNNFFNNLFFFPFSQIASERCSNGQLVSVT